MKRVIVLTMVLSVSAVPGVLHAADAVVGKEKAAGCSGCHMAGNPTAPVLNGMPEEYLNKATLAYKTGERKDPVMQGLVASLSEEDIANISAYYAAEKQCQ